MDRVSIRLIGFVGLVKKRMYRVSRAANVGRLLYMNGWYRVGMVGSVWYGLNLGCYKVNRAGIVGRFDIGLVGLLHRVCRIGHVFGRVVRGLIGLVWLVWLI